MRQANSQITAIAYLVRKFGNKIPGGGYEVIVTYRDLMDMPPHGTFQEVPDNDLRVIKWQYFPNPTIEGEEVKRETETAELPEKTND